MAERVAVVVRGIHHLAWDDWLRGIRVHFVAQLENTGDIAAEVRNIRYTMRGADGALLEAGDVPHAFPQKLAPGQFGVIGRTISADAATGPDDVSEVVVTFDVRRADNPDNLVEVVSVRAPELGDGDVKVSGTVRNTSEKTYDNIKIAWEEALEQAVDLLEGEARRRATGINRDVWYAGEVVGTERAYSDTLLIFLLKAHRPAKFRDNVKVEHSAGANPATRALLGGHVGTPPSGAEGRTESPAKATWPQRDIRGDTLAAGARRALSRLGLESVTEVLRRILVPPAPAAA